MENGDGDGDGDAFPFFFNLPCPVLPCSVLVANCTHEHVEKLIHNTPCASQSLHSVTQSVNQSVSSSILSSRCCCLLCGIFSNLSPLLPSHLTQPSRQPAELPSWRNITTRSITYRRTLRKLHTAASGPHTNLVFPLTQSLNYSLHYRCISAE